MQRIRTLAASFVVASLGSLVLAPAARAQCGTQQLGPGDANSWQQFGASVALDAGRALIGAPFTTPANQGAAYVYESSAGVWTQAAKLVAGDALPNDCFGAAVALSGGRAIVSAVPIGAVPPGSGQAYVFEHDGLAWHHVARLDPHATSKGFGTSAVIDGDVAMVGALVDTQLGVGSGVVYVFERASGAWSFAQKLRAADAANNDSFGCAIALSGAHVVIGARQDNHQGANAGSAYVFEHSGGSWRQVAKLVPSDPFINAFFGESVALSGSGAGIRALVGAPHNNSAALESGAAYVFEVSPYGWTQTARIQPAIPLFLGVFGAHVALAGERALIAGEAASVFPWPTKRTYVFERVGSTWLERSAHSMPIGAAFGSAVALDGTTALVSAKIDGFSGVPGSAFVFDTTGAAAATLTASPASLSLAAGGQQALTVQTCGPYGGQLCIVLGSASGTNPGTPIGALSVPLVLDSYALFTASSPNTAPLSGSFGKLAGAGTRTTTLTVPAGTDAALAGVQLHHAAIVIDPAGALVCSTNAVSLQLVP